jgi:hypothetical protein
MEYATFRKWLAEHGCRFDTQSEKRGEGHGTVTIHRAGRTAELPLVGASHNLDPRSVHQVCDGDGVSAFDPKRTLCSQGTLGLAQLLMWGSSCKTTFSNELWISIWPL